MTNLSSSALVCWWPAAFCLPAIVTLVPLSAQADLSSTVHLQGLESNWARANMMPMPAWVQYPAECLACAVQAAQPPLHDWQHSSIVHYARGGPAKDSSSPTMISAGALDKSKAQTAGLQLELQPPQPQTSVQADTPTLTFPTPSFRPHQRTPTLTGPAVLLPESPRLTPAPRIFPSSPLPAALPQGSVSLSGAAPARHVSTSPAQANSSQPQALPSSPVHGVWHRSQQPLPTSQEGAFASDRGNANRDDIADVAAEMIAETPQMQSRLQPQPARPSSHGQEDVFDHRSLLMASVPQSDALLVVSLQTLQHILTAYGSC